MQKFDYIRNKAINIFKRYGYQEVLLNIVEHEELFHRTLGEESDILSQKVFKSSIHVEIKGNVPVQRPLRQRISIAT